MPPVFEGIKVLDLCRSYPPAFGAMFLADFGADVIRIDRPDFKMPLPLPCSADELAAHFAADRNKRSLALNLKSAEGREVFYRLAKTADVILENSRPGTMDKLGIGYAKIKEMNPRIIYCSVSGYGKDGPYNMKPGHDINYLAISGALSMFGEKGGPPIAPSNLVADMAGAGLYPLTGILMALFGREKTGQGQFVDISYTDAVFSLMTFEVAMYHLTGMLPKRGETLRTGLEPSMTSYQTKDGKWFSIACIEFFLWKNFCEAIGREDLLPHQYPQTEEKRQEIFKILRELFLTKTRDEWWQWAQDKDIAATPVLELDEALEDPQINHRQMVMEVEHPTVGKVKQTGFAVKLSETPAEFKRFSPKIGEHTVEILKTLGYDDGAIAKLKENSVV